LKEKQEFHDLQQDNTWCMKLVYLTDVFEHLNEVNLVRKEGTKVS
jgi:hypothetical protein